MASPDKHLVDRIRQRDAAAWQECIDRYEGRLLAYVRKRIGDQTAAEDIVQETFIGFLTSLPNFDDRMPIEGFLFTIASHKLIDALRRSGRRPSLPLLSLSASENASPVPPGSARVASSLARSGERRNREASVLSDALGELIDQWQADGDWERLKCIELLFVLGWRNQRVAEHMGISAQAVANHKHFVVRKLTEAAKRAQIPIEVGALVPE